MIRDGQLILTLGTEWGSTLSQIKTLAFFPYDEGSIEYAAPQTLTRSDGTIDLAMKIGYQPPQSGPIRGVLLATEQSGNQAIPVPIEIAASFAPGAASRGGAGIAAPARFAPRVSAAAGSATLRLCRYSCCWPSWAA